MIQVMEGLSLTNDWQQFNRVCKDQFRDKDWDWKSSPWGRLLNGKRIFVVLSHEGETHAKWRMFVNGSWIRDLNLNCVLGSAKDAMQFADKNT